MVRAEFPEVSTIVSRTGRPDEVLEALGFDPLDVRIHRTGMVLVE